MKTFLKRLLQGVLIIGVVAIFLSILGGDKNGDQSKDPSGSTSTERKTGTSENNSDGGLSVTQKGERVLSTHVIEQASGAKGSPNYDATLQKGIDAGIESLNMTVNWNDAEASDGTFKPDVFVQANRYYAFRNIKMDLDLRPVDTAGIMLPEDLTGKALNDPEVIVRFKKFLDNVFGVMPDVKFNFLAIGNEVDSVFINDKKRYAEYEGFLKEVIPYAKTKRHGLKVGMIVTYAGLTSGDADEYQKLNALTDVIILTYYPLKGDYTTKKLPIFEKEISKVFSLYPKSQIYFSEIGYPSSYEAGGSEAKQAEFVREVFKVWDAHSDRIAGVAFFTLNELTTSSVNDLTKYFSVATKEFIATLGSMGLIAANGREKEAFKVLQEEAQKRGW